MDARYVTDKACSLIKALHNPPIGAKEFSGGWCPERCDAVLFCSSYSYMIETKISRSDFLADFKKPHRINGGIGNYRYYACPEGLIKPEELPEKWGLIYVRPNNQRAIMPVGFGGRIRNPNKDTRHEQGWRIEGFDIYGTTELNEYGNPICVHAPFYFKESQYERNFLFALATRYKTGKFPDNLM